VDCETDDPGEASRLYAELECRGLVSRQWGAGAEPGARREGTEAHCEPPGGERPPLPRALDAFVRRLGARAIGAPVPHPRFKRYVVPMLADLDALPKSTLALFEPSASTALAPSCAALVRVAREGVRQLDRHPVGRALIAGTLPKLYSHFGAVSKKEGIEAAQKRRSGAKVPRGRDPLASPTCGRPLEIRLR
jgi:hypothetical protein